MFFPSVLLIEKWGVKAALMFSSVCSLIGMWLNHYEIDKAGEIIINFGLPFVMNSFTKMTAQWFPQKERIFATFAALFFNIFG